MANPMMVFEDIHSARRLRLGRLFGVPVYATPLAWLNPVSVALLMLATTFFVYPEAGAFERLAWAALWTLLFVGISTLHSLGHIVSGKLAGSAMDALLITATRQVNLYEGDQSGCPPRVHIARAIGGPLANLLGGAAGLILIAALGYSPTLVGWTLLNFAFGLGSLLPVESVDGAVIVRYLRERGVSQPNR